MFDQSLKRGRRPTVFAAKTIPFSGLDLGEQLAPRENDVKRGVYSRRAIHGIFFHAADAIAELTHEIHQLMQRRFALKTRHQFLEMRS
jgi:hypothetical protein